MRLHRFYVNFPLGEEIVVESLDGSSEKEILNQWQRVFRFTEGNEVLLFSSLTPNSDFRYRITSISKSAAHLALVAKETNIIPSKNLTLVMALVKKDTFETIVRHATELGVTRIIPVIASRSEKKSLNFERLSVISIEASEQCGRGDIVEITGILTLEEALLTTKDCKNVLGSLYGEPFSLGTLKEDRLALWVGPEGGWTEEEENKAKENNFTLLKLTDTVLKADTAAIALLSLSAA